MQNEETALHKACASDHVEVAATLLKHGANADKEDKVRLMCVHGQHGVTQNGPSVSGLDTWFCTHDCMTLYNIL